MIQACHYIIYVYDFVTASLNIKYLQQIFVNIKYSQVKFGNCCTIKLRLIYMS